MKKNFALAFLISGLNVNLALAHNHHEDTFQVLGNGERGLAPAHSQVAATWYEKNLPFLPADYIEANGFVPFEPLVHFADQVNWSIFPAGQFKKVSKERWLRIPAGTKIKRDADKATWQWPIGAETAKLFGGSVKGKDGRETIQKLELRLARKISEENGKSNWAMAAFVQDAKKGGWKIAMPPHLELVVPSAVTPLGKVRKVSYSLTSPDGCMTCHARGGNSPVDYKRGDEFVYGANEELVSGKARMRLSVWLTSPETREHTTEMARSREDDWIDVTFKDTGKLEKNRQALMPLFE